MHQDALRREMVLRLADPGVETGRSTCWRRWKVETVTSAVQRRCGDALNARLDETQRARALLRGAAYDVQ